MALPFPKVEYVLFDLDGLMVDSERIYTDVTNNILAEYGVQMTWEMKAGLMGKPERDAAAHLLAFFPTLPLTLDAYLLARNVQQDALWPSVALLPGVARLVAHLAAHGVPMAIATGSRRRNLEMKVAGHPAVFAPFVGAGRIACADDGMLGPGRGKPSPDIYLWAARELLGRKVGEVGKEAGQEMPEEEVRERARGLVFEDAIPGLQAGKRAGMSVVWIPDPNLLDVEYTGVERADQTLKSMADFVPEEWGLPPYSAAPGL